MSIEKIIVSGARGARGLTGPASGPLGADSILAEHISDTAADQDEIREKLRAVELIGTGAAKLSGVNADSSVDARADAKLIIDGLVNSDSAIVLFQIVDPTKEMGSTYYAKDSANAWKQLISEFVAFKNDDDTAGAHVSYFGIHGGEGGAFGDVNPFVVTTANVVLLGCGSTAAELFDNDDTPESWVRAYSPVRADQGLIVGDDHEFALPGATTRLSTVGYAHFGQVDGSGNKTVGVLVGDAGSGSVVEFVNMDTAALTVGSLVGSEIKVSGGHFTPATNNTYDLGKSGTSFRNAFLNNAATISSDNRLKDWYDNPELGVWDGEEWCPSAKAIAWANAVRFGPYQLKDAVAEKGVDGARVHWGVSAQRTARVGVEAGIANPYFFGSFLTLDPRFETVAEQIPVERPVMEEYETTVTQTVFEGDAARKIKRKVIKTRRKQPDMVPLLDAHGKPMTKLERQPKRTRNPATGKEFVASRRRVPVMVPRPVTEIVMEDVEVSAPVILAEATSKAAKSARDLATGKRVTKGRRPEGEGRLLVLIDTDDGPMPGFLLPDGRVQDALHGVRYEAMFGFLFACGGLNATTRHETD